MLLFDPKDFPDTFELLRQYFQLCSRQPRRLVSILFLTVTLCFFYFIVLGYDDRIEFDMRPAEMAVEIKAIQDFPIWPLQLEDEAIRDRSSAYKPTMFTAKSPSFASFASLVLFKPVTAVIYRVSDNDEGIQQVVKHLSKYPFFKEILIFNQIESRPLVVEDFGGEMSEDVSIEIYDSRDDIQTMGRFTTCSMASHETCYTQDDVWLNIYLDTLYTLSLKSPELVYASARPTEYLDALGWRFGNIGNNTNNNIDSSLHTGYVDLRYGAFIPRHKAQTFLTQLAEQGITKAQLRQADMYFSLWTNQYPWILSNSLVSLEQEDKLNPIIRSPSLYENMYDAMDKLGQSLAENITQKDHFNRLDGIIPLESRQERASCVNDKCLFITNIDPFPEPGTFVPATDLDSGIESLQSRKSTVPKANDYFGLTMVGSIEAKRLVLYGRRDIRHAASMFNVTVESVENNWVTCKLWTLPDAQVVRQRVPLGIDCSGVKEFKTIRIHFVEDQKEPFDVCGIGLDNFNV
ncbi:hypothetical protein J3Q64DRAFT_1756751 [Phycomyces blakesleeanus]|uniref:Uncharacterized protein n=1 Tax=Phycomyces blakesleeanus TaxID=4837 RepID=A0ABR3ATN4_PHYBL